MNNNFTLYIISYGRPNNYTAKYLQQINYRGNWSIVLDNSDKTIDQYKEIYGEDRLIIYDKKQIEFDSGLKDKVYTSAVFSRNACELISEIEGYDYFFLLDDDIKSLSIRYEKDGVLKSKPITKNLEKLFDRLVDFVKDGNISTISFGYQLVYIAGLEGFKENSDKDRRLCAEAFLRNKKFPITWNCTYMEDFIASVEFARKGQVFLQIPDIMVSMPAAYESKEAGGNTELYTSENKMFKVKESVKVFFPECVNLRVDEKTGKPSANFQNNKCVPKIVSEV